MCLLFSGVLLNSRGKHSIAWKEIIMSCASGSLNLLYLNTFLSVDQLINKVHVNE